MHRNSDGPAGGVCEGGFSCRDARGRTSSRSMRDSDLGYSDAGFPIKRRPSSGVFLLLVIVGLFGIVIGIFVGSAEKPFPIYVGAGVSVTAFLILRFMPFKCPQCRVTLKRRQEGQWFLCDCPGCRISWKVGEEHDTSD